MEPLVHQSAAIETPWSIFKETTYHGIVYGPPTGHPAVPVVPCDESAVRRAIEAYDDLMCPECDGEGKVSKFLEPETQSGITEVECPVCMGSGDPYPELVVRTILEAAGRAGS